MRSSSLFIMWAVKGEGNSPRMLVLCFKTATNMPGVVAHAFNLTSWEVDAGKHL